MVDKSGLPFGIAQRVRDRAYLDSLHDEHCWLCGATPCEPAHVRWGLEGSVGAKPPDDLVVPLCHEHHQEQELEHTGRRDALFWMRVFKAILRRRYQAWKATR